MKELYEFLQLLGLSEDDIKIYIFLLQNGESTVLQISKIIGLNRTEIYRLCDKLEKQGYVRKIPELKTTKYEASSIDFLNTKVAEISSKTQLIRKEFTKFEGEYKREIAVRSGKIQVIHYNGQKEVRQLLWNYLEAGTEVLSLGYRTLGDIVGKEFMVRWWNESLRRGIATRILANPGTFQLKNKLDDLLTREKYAKDPQEVWSQRVVDPKVFKCKQETFIYDDIYAIVQWDGDQIFGVEIHNKGIANMKRQEFEILWGLGKP